MKPSPHFTAESLTFLENWPAALSELSIAQVDIPLSRQDIFAIGTNMLDWFEAFGETTVDPTSLIQRVDDAVKAFPNGAFVRLGSRSPKDAFVRAEQFRVRSGAEAFTVLTAGSERIYADLQAALTFEYIPHIFVREWTDIPKCSEFRCFMRDRQLVGISQYFYRHQFSEIADDKNRIREAIEEFFVKFKTVCHLDTVCFDVFLTADENSGYVPRLVEINPFPGWTDPCLFKDGVFDGSFRSASL
jgi:D123